MRLLIIGGSGFLSGTLVGEASGAGHQVTVVTRGRRPLPRGVEALVADRSETAAVAAALGGREFDAVVDCIGFRVEDAAQDLELFAGRAGHLVFISTDFVYGGQPRRLPLTETATTDALNPYGRNKRACEELLLRDGPARGLGITVLRPPHILGAGSHLGTGSLQGRDTMLLDRLRHGAPIVLLDGGTLLIQPVSATDVARGALAAVTRGSGVQAFRRSGRRAPGASTASAGSVTGAVYNVAGPDGVTTRQYYEIVAEILGCRLQVLSLPSRLWVDSRPDRAPFAQHRLYDTGALVREVGYTPKVTLEAVIRETIQWLEQSGAAQPYVAGAFEAALVERLHTADREVAALLQGPSL
jgi:nucleoside-diphosphate-sugar epimerase